VVIGNLGCQFVLLFLAPRSSRTLVRLVLVSALWALLIQRFCLVPIRLFYPCLSLFPCLPVPQVSGLGRVCVLTVVLVELCSLFVFFLAVLRTICPRLHPLRWVCGHPLSLVVLELGLLVLCPVYYFLSPVGEPVGSVRCSLVPWEL
jgi:hypothetical protein